MKFTVNKNEAYMKIKITGDHELKFMYGFNLEQPENGFDPETPECEALADCIAVIAGLVHLSKHNTEDVIEVGNAAIENGDFDLGDEKSETMARFMQGLSEEEIELLHIKPEGEA